jgi:hypothetical protein
MDGGLDGWKEREQLKLEPGLPADSVELSRYERLRDVGEAGDDVGDPDALPGLLEPRGCGIGSRSRAVVTLLFRNHLHIMRPT